MSHSIVAIMVAALLLLLPACTSTSQNTYRGGVLVQAGILDVEDYYVFRLVDKWRISHQWLSGEADIRYCLYSHRDSGREEDRFFEIDGMLKVETVSEAPKNKGKKFVSVRDEKIYGANPSNSEFKRYSSFCTHTFQDIWSGVSVFLIKPDPAKGTDEWVAGAKSVTVNGLHWLRKDTPAEDYSQNRERWAAPIETWVLKIPDTSYWFVMRLSGTTGGSGTAAGINRNPAKFAQVQDLLHQMVASVKLEPIDVFNSNTSAEKR